MPHINYDDFILDGSSPDEKDKQLPNDEENESDDTDSEEEEVYDEEDDYSEEDSDDDDESDEEEEPETQRKYRKREEKEEDVFEQITFKPLVNSVLDDIGLQINGDFMIQDSPEGLKEFIVNLYEYARRTPVYHSEIAQKIDEYVAKGGNAEEYIKHFFKQEFNPYEYKAETIDEKKELIAVDMRKRGVNEKIINKTLDALERDDEIDEEYEQVLEKMQKEYDEEMERKEKEMVEMAERGRKEAMENVKRIYNSIMEADSIAGFRMTPATKEKFAEFILKPDKDGMTMYNKLLIKDPKMSMEFAALAFNHVYGNGKGSYKDETNIARLMRKKIDNYQPIRNERSRTNDSYKNSPSKKSKVNLDDFVL
jgi:hypothetical protein